MARRFPSILFAILAGTLSAGHADARNRSAQDSNLLTPIMDASPTLAPFQHVLKRVNHSVNLSIIPTVKDYGPNLGDGWTIAPDTGDCNDYAVTKRHQLLESGLPSKALRLSVVKTASGIGHLVLVVVTTKGDVVMDNLTEVIRPWQSTDYHWLKIQSATDSKFWYEVKAPAVGPSVSQAERKLRLANR